MIPARPEPCPRCQTRTCMRYACDPFAVLPEPASLGVDDIRAAIGEGIEIQASLGASPPFTISSGNGALPLEGF